MRQADAALGFGVRLSNTRHVGLDGVMRLTSVTLPNGKTPSWEDATMLNIGVGVLEHFKVQVTDDEWMVPRDKAYAPIVHMTVVFNFSAGRYTASFVGLEAVHEITGTDLREIRVAEVLQLASAAGIYIKLNAGGDPVSVHDWHGGDQWRAVNSADLEKVKSAGAVDWVLEEIALVYNIAQISSQPPAKAVEKAFGLPARTAARWIAKAKERGILNRPSIPGWEHLVEASDGIRDSLAQGVPLVEQIPEEAFKWPEGEDGER